VVDKRREQAGLGRRQLVDRDKLEPGDTVPIALWYEGVCLRGEATIIRRERGGLGRPSRIEIDVRGERRVLNHRQFTAAVVRARQEARRDRDKPAE
jgi:hypothetical protein